MPLKLPLSCKVVQNRWFLDPRFVGGGYASPYGPLRPHMTSSIKPEVHNVSQHRQRKTEPWPQGICTTNFVKIGQALPEICSRTDRHTHRQTDKLIAIRRSILYRIRVTRQQLQADQIVILYVISVGDKRTPVFEKTCATTQKT